MQRTGNYLKEIRISLGLTQKKLSELTGINKYTIQNIEQELRKGSKETWDILESFFNSANISYDSTELIEELKEDIKEFGEDKIIIAFFKYILDKKIYTNYDFIVDELPFTKNELKLGEKIEKIKAKELLQYLIIQNKI